MIAVIDIEKAGYPIVQLPDMPPLHGLEPSRTEHPYRPAPQPDDNLVVDPEIKLPSPGMDVEIAYFYSAASPYNGPFGYGRTISPNLSAQASGNPAIVTLTRGNGALVSYQDDGAGHFNPKTPGLFNTLVKDTTHSYWKESTPDGRLCAYPLDTTGQISMTCPHFSVPLEMLVSRGL